MPWTLALRILGPLALLAALWWGVDHVLDQREQDGYARGSGEVQNRWDKDKAARAELARHAAEQALQLKEAERLAKQKDDDEQARLLADSAAALASTRGERELFSQRLRIALNTIRAGATGSGPVPAAGPASCRVDASAEAAIELLDRCAERREGVAFEASGLARQVIGLQAEVRRAQLVCGLTPGPALPAAE